MKATTKFGEFEVEFKSHHIVPGGIQGQVPIDDQTFVSIVAHPNPTGVRFLHGNGLTTWEVAVVDADGASDVRYDQSAEEVTRFIEEAMHDD